MKTILFLSALIAFFNAASHAQSVDSLQYKNLEIEMLLRKSRQQRTWATVTVVTGSVTAIAGGCLWFLAPIAGLSGSGNVEGAERTGKTLVIVGTTLAATSIPLYIAGARNKQKAKLVFATSQIRFPSRMVNQMSVGLRIGLG
jgi:hypothetical protein